MIGLQLRPAMAPALDNSTSTMNGMSTNERWEQLVTELWLSQSNTRKEKPDTIKSMVWDPLEAEAFSWRSLSYLESLQILERYGDEKHPHNLTISNGVQGICGRHTMRTPQTI
jgi:intron-binding protein aquarius